MTNTLDLPGLHERNQMVISNMILFFWGTKQSSGGKLIPSYGDDIFSQNQIHILDKDLPSLIIVTACMMLILVTNLTGSGSN